MGWGTSPAHAVSMSAAASFIKRASRYISGFARSRRPRCATTSGTSPWRRGDLNIAADLFSDSLQLYRTYDERRGMAECIIGLAGVAAHSGDHRRAARLLGAAEAIFESLGAQLSPSNRADFSRVVALARAGCTPTQFSASWTDGHKPGLEQPVAEALGCRLDLSHNTGSPTPRGLLTAREAEVVTLIARGCTNRDIAHSLVIAEGTVERHVANIFRKLGCRSRAQVASWVAQQPPLHTGFVGNPG